MVLNFNEGDLQHSILENLGQKYTTAAGKIGIGVLPGSVCTRRGEPMM